MWHIHEKCRICDFITSSCSLQLS